MFYVKVMEVQLLVDNRRNPMKLLSVFKPSLLCDILINLYLCVFLFLFSDKEVAYVHTRTYIHIIL